MGILTSLTRSKSVGTLEDPDTGLYEALDIEPEAAGVRVNSKTGLTYPPVFRALSLISGDIMKLPLIVYKREGEGKRRAVDHRAYKLLKYQWNGTLTSAQGKRYVTACAVWRGNGYAYIQRDNGARPKRIVPLDPQDITPYKVDGDIWYMYQPTKKPIRWENMIHVRGFGTDMVGYSLVDKAKESLGLGMAAQKYGASFFENSGTPHVVFKYPGEVTDEMRDNIIKSWKNRHGGPGDSFKTAVLEEGMDVEGFPINNDELQFLETREFEIKQVANWFGLPPHKLGDNTKTSYNSLEQENQSYLDECLDQWLVSWESECRSKLLTTPQKNRDTHTVEFIRAALLRANLSARGDYYEAALRNGWMNRDEVRARENLNPLTSDIGEAVTIEKNMTVFDSNGNMISEDDEETESNALDAHYDMIESVAERMCKRLAKHVESKGCEQLRDKHEHVVREAFEHPVKALRSITGDTCEIDTLVDEMFQRLKETDNVEKWSEEYPATMIQEIKDATA